MTDELERDNMDIAALTKTKSCKRKEYFTNYILFYMGKCEKMEKIDEILMKIEMNIWARETGFLAV